jgi:PPOX class probable F420-dependent enzyme
VDGDTMRQRFGEARVARLSTADERGRPHLVPVCFALERVDDGDRIASIVDAKPKSTTALKRLANVAANPQVSILVDHYDEEWSSLWWVRVDGVARVLEGGPEHAAAAAALTAKYPQYRSVALAGPALIISVQRWRSWSATGAA